MEVQYRFCSGDHEASGYYPKAGDEVIVRCPAALAERGWKNPDRPRRAWVEKVCEDNPMAVDLTVFSLSHLGKPWPGDGIPFHLRAVPPDVSSEEQAACWRHAEDTDKGLWKAPR